MTTTTAATNLHYWHHAYANYAFLLTSGTISTPRILRLNCLSKICIARISFVSAIGGL